jgi:hypothetical protein
MAKIEKDKPAKKLSEKEAQSVVDEYLRSQNRPYSAKDIEQV